MALSGQLLGQCRYPIHMTNLVRQQIVDKNGNLTTRWVKDYGYSTSNRSLPAPTAVTSTTESKLPRGAVKEMKEIKASLTTRLKAQHKEVNRMGYTFLHDQYTDCLHEVTNAVQNRHYERLRVYDKYMDVNFKPQYLTQFVDYLQSQGHEGIAESLSPETMEGFNALSKKLRTSTLGGYPETIKHMTEEERNDLMDHAGELMYLKPGSEEKIYSLIVDHGIKNHDQLTAALEESDRINTPFIGGIL